MRCSKCGADNRPTARFCDGCGAQLQPQCPSCGGLNRAGAKFCDTCGAALSAPSAPSHVTTVEPTSVRVNPEALPSDAPDGERKTVTALFADIKGSMELMEDLDPEEARAIVDPALKLMIDAAHHYDGYIVQSTGDGVFALFGAPLAHEDHPQRAFYAALRMQAAGRAARRARPVSWRADSSQQSPLHSRRSSRRTRSSETNSRTCRRCKRPWFARGFAIQLRLLSPLVWQVPGGCFAFGGGDW
jgi:hypothetical protein